VALLADFLGLPPPTPLQMSPELQRRKTIDLLAQWTVAMSVQPLVVLVEDLQWCDASSLELLGHLIAQSPTARVLLLATARSEFTLPWPGRSNMTMLPLARLTKRHAHDMVVILAGEGLPAATLDALVARADGVPLYIEELTKAMAVPGLAPSVEAIPVSLTDSLMARLDRLSAAKAVAQRAAVLGREFGYPLLAAMAGSTRPPPCATGWRAWSTRKSSSRAVSRRGHLHLQARADPGDGVPVAAQAHASAAARVCRSGTGRTLPRARRCRARGGRAARGSRGARRHGGHVLPASR
jgi:predicted ATPase